MIYAGFFENFDDNVVAQNLSNPARCWPAYRKSFRAVYTPGFHGAINGSTIAPELVGDLLYRHI